ncbi:MAG: helix-turn-helix transcriptional regulator [Roseburia sp.]|nr:helix-turn-helix transcriptional regulator [Roseburia sp.]
MSRMKELREEKGITQEELAFVLEISQQRVSKIERNKAPLNDVLIVKCAKYFGVTTDYFLGASDLRLEVEMTKVNPEHLNETRFREFVHYFTRMDSAEQDALINIQKLIYNLHGKE